MKLSKYKFNNPKQAKLSETERKGLLRTNVDKRLKAINAFIPKNLAEKTRKKKGKIEGERRFVTVMFTGVSG